MTSIGGSDAQDDLFRQTYLRSLQAAGRHADAAAYAARITGGKSRTPLDHALASGLQSGSTAGKNTMPASRRALSVG